VEVGNGIIVGSGKGVKVGENKGVIGVGVDVDGMGVESASILVEKVVRGSGSSVGVGEELQAENMETKKIKITRKGFIVAVPCVDIHRMKYSLSITQLTASLFGQLTDILPTFYRLNFDEPAPIPA